MIPPRHTSVLLFALAGLGWGQILLSDDFTDYSRTRARLGDSATGRYVFVSDSPAPIPGGIAWIRLAGTASSRWEAAPVPF